VTALVLLTQALLSQLPEDPASAIITVKSDNSPASPPNGQKYSPDSPVYDPAVVYLLELSTVLALRDEESIASLGSDVAEALQNVIRDATNHHSTTVSRATFYLLNLLKTGYVSVLSKLPLALADNV
jgi:brefeldin A-resistance guanine nucleotide exchange factor 1